MLTGAALNCGPQPSGTSTVLRWSVIAVKLNGKGGSQGRATKNVIMDTKTSFFDVMSEVQNDL
jgi:hypothetical protein